MVALVTDIILSWKATAIVSLLRLHPSREHCSGFDHVMDEPVCYRCSYIHLGCAVVAFTNSCLGTYRVRDNQNKHGNLSSFVVLIRSLLVFFRVEIKACIYGIYLL